MGEVSCAPAESEAFYNPTYTHILCFTVKCVILRSGTGNGTKKISSISLDAYQ